jgi:Rieske Fe-S protein
MSHTLESPEESKGRGPKRQPCHAGVPNFERTFVSQVPEAAPVSLLSRREFARLTSLACVAAACSSDSGSPTAPAGSGVTISGNTMTVPLSANQALSQPNGMILVAQARALVIRISATEYRAMTSVCTHESCTVSRFDGSRLTCPCHGSQFSTAGAVVTGPASRALRVYPTTFDAASGVITVNLA